MKWLFATILVLVSGAVGAFAIYTFGWREDAGSESADARLAVAYANELTASCAGCQRTRLEESAPGVWPPRPMRLWCEECGRPSGPEAKFWRLILVADPDEDEESVLAAYCPACAASEFGQTRTERKKAE